MPELTSPSLSESTRLHVYFGGSFDPPHLGHDDMLRALLVDSWVTRVHLVPTGQNPLKGARASEERLDWLAEWVKSLNAKLGPALMDKLTVETLEIERSKNGEANYTANYTIDSLRVLKLREGGRWVLVLGSDLIPQLPRWKKINELLTELHSLWVFPRHDASSTLLDLDSSLRELVPVRYMVTHPVRAASTEIRVKLERDLEAHEREALPLIPELKNKIGR